MSHFQYSYAIGCSKKPHIDFDNIAYFVPRFPIYNQALRAKITSLNLILPAAALDTALFTDGTSKEILRPGENQVFIVFNFKLQWGFAV